MYTFAKNAVPLPASPDMYKRDTAYSQPPGDDLINNGLRSGVNAETSALNCYFNLLSLVIDNWQKNGIVSIYPDLFSLTDPKDKDLKRNPSNPEDILIFLDNQWKKLEGEATETDDGFIKLDKILTKTEPFDSLPISTRDIPGTVYVDNIVAKNDFNSLPTVQIMNNPPVIVSDDNDYGETRYFQTNKLTVNLFPERDTSKFYLKHLRFNNSYYTLTFTLPVNNTVSYTTMKRDLYVLSNGNIFG
jgi:hypothetical protein